MQLKWFLTAIAVNRHEYFKLQKLFAFRLFSSRQECKETKNDYFYLQFAQ